MTKTCECKYRYETYDIFNDKGDVIDDIMKSKRQSIVISLLKIGEICCF